MVNIRPINDFTVARKNAKNIIGDHLEGRGEFSISYIAQLLSATVVCTLGLITNSTAVIIGGMIIAPLMWPILNASYRLATKKAKVSINPFVILVASTFVIFIGAALVATLTPYKQITSEVLLRTSPTSLEIFIALAAAVIAALAIAIPKISDSVAGVAVATSLVPPLCVSGIGLAYFNLDVLYGGFLLFLVNALTIMFVSTLIFSLLIYGRDFTHLKKKEVALLALSLIILSFPLYGQLQNSVSSATISSSAKSIIESNLKNYAPNSELENYQVKLSSDGKTVSIRAVVLLSTSQTITYEQEQELTNQLSSKLSKQVDFHLVQQDSIKPISDKKVQELNEQTQVKDLLASELKKFNEDIKANSISAELSEDGNWNISASLRTSNDSTIGTDDISKIEKTISTKIGRPVTISIEIVNSTIIGSTKIKSNEEIVSDYIFKQPGVVEIVSLALKQQDSGTQSAKIVLLVSPEQSPLLPSTETMQSDLSSLLGKPIELQRFLIDSRTQ